MKIMIKRLHVLTLPLVLVFAALAQGQTFTTLYNFTDGTDGFGLEAGVIQDPSGNLYGTAYNGGDLNCDGVSGPGYGCGVVYELDTAGTETVLYTFTGNPDGDTPIAPVTRDNAGNLYGATWGGGTSSNCCGTVFKIDAAGNETVLYSFTGGSDGCSPDQGLAEDSGGNLYGTAERCGTYGHGTIFKIDSAGNFTLLHSFAGTDGKYPQLGHLTMDDSGNLYGLTNTGGTGKNPRGTLYELSNSGTFTLLHTFRFGEGFRQAFPRGSVALDKHGNFYGTTGSNIWRVNRKGKETVLHTFAGGTSDGCGPEAGVTLDPEGNLYGVTTGCGSHECYEGAGCGVVYERSASGRYTLLHRFDGSDGALPVGEVLWTTDGALYGTTAQGGTGKCPTGYSGCGTVWEYEP